MPSRPLRLLAAIALSAAAAAGSAAAQTAPAAPAAATVTPYPAAFFGGLGVDTALDMVQRIPGFVVDDGAAVRGFAGAAGNVLIEGQRPASKTDSLSAILKRIPAGQVARIDLIRGGAPGIDMQGKTVVANVIRKAGGGFAGVASLGQYTTGDGYTDPQARLEGTWRDGQRTLQAAVYAFKGHDNSQGGGPHEVIGPDGQVLDRSDMHNTEPTWIYEATGAYETPLLGGRFRGNLLVEAQPIALENRDDFRVAGVEDEHETIGKDDAELGLHFNRDLGAALGLELIGLQHLNRGSIDSTFDTSSDHQRFALRDHGGESIGRVVVHWRPAAALTLDAGGEGAFNWLSTRTRFTDNGVPIAVPAADVTVQEARSEAFATATWRPLASLVVEAGARVEASRISSRGDVVLSKTLVFPKPRVAVTWSPDPADQFRLRVEREVGQLDFNAFAASASLNSTGVVAGNPNLAPQQDWAFEAAYDRRFWTDGIVSLTLRHLVLQDVIDRAPIFAPSGVFDAPANIGGGSEDDLVASFSLPLARLGLPRASLRGVGTWRVSRVSDPTTGEIRRISGQDVVDAELHFVQDLPRWKLSWGVDTFFGVHQQLFRFNEVDAIRTRTVSTPYVEWKPRPDIALLIAVDLNRGRFDQTRQVFSGPRSLDPLAFTDFQDHRFGPVSFIRLRKTFG
ncbi:MAG TPA: TonB-dependent receptor [Phenylobacterium sp.]|nr:TonB-dependent receptor [Phenylobacterium sp.]